MAELNKVFLAGNLTRDPELRHIPSGTALAELRLAINRRSKDSSGKDRDEVIYVDVTVWDRQAENCAQYLTKGSPVLVEGRLKLDQWEKDGKKQSKLSVVGERVQFLSKGPGGGGGGRSNSASEFEDAPPARSSSRPASADRVPQEEILDDSHDDVPF